MNLVLLLGGLALVVFGILSIVAWRLQLREHAAMPKLGCGEVERGHRCRVEGRVAAGRSLTAPISGTVCVHFRLEFYWLGRHARNHRLIDTVDASSNDTQVAATEESVLWRLEDAAGSVEVDSTGAEVQATSVEATYGALLGSPRDGELRTLCERAGVTDLDRQCRIVETCIPLGEQVQARGAIREDLRLAGGRELVLCVPPFKEGEAERRRALWGIVLLVSGLALAGAALLGFGARDWQAGRDDRNPLAPFVPADPRGGRPHPPP